MTAGDILPGYEGYESSDPSIAWVAGDGSLHAMRAGSASVTDGGTSCVVNVDAVSDGSDTVGSLKILARYNDSMEFYDGHVYLLFTSYVDNLEISVPDLYCGYEISDQYYADIAEDISVGSNHSNGAVDKETAAAQYFTENRAMTSVTLDRGQIVTIGMYRDFELSVPQAALGSIQNSTIVKTAADPCSTAKTVFMESLFSYLKYKEITSESAAGRFISGLQEKGIDPNLFLDGTVGGGVCFNRELYNQKLEWDQYENVTYELDITGNQLDRLTAALSGNLNRFSILKNSCATVALRAWNAAVGTKDGEPNAYYLDPAGEGIYAYIDAPKTVKDEIMNKLPGYYLNNAETGDPDSGYQEGDGWVYVSAPKKLDTAPDGSEKNSAYLAAEGTEHPVGRMTIAAREFGDQGLVSHSMIVFTPYSDLNLDVSFYTYYKPTDAYAEMINGEGSDVPRLPADTCFEEIHNGAYSEPETITVKAGESITLSNYPHEENHLQTVIKTLESSRIDAQTLLVQMHIYDDGGQIDGPLAFDSMTALLKQMYDETSTTGSNPVDGTCAGGTDINREVYNRVLRGETSAPFAYYTVEISADELESFRSYLADPKNNYYSLMLMNCTTGVVNLWNATLADRPELALTANLTGLAMDSFSLRWELSRLAAGNEYKGSGEGGGGACCPGILPDTEPDPMDCFKRTASYTGFSDVDEGSWYGTEQDGVVRAAVELGIMNGYPDGTFRPQDNIKLCEAVKMAAVVRSIYEGDGHTFDMTEGEKWYDTYFDYAVGKGMIEAARSEKPEELATRTQTARIFAAALPESEFPSVHEDVHIPDSADPAVRMLYAAGVLTGYEDGTFDGESFITRAEAAAVITRAALPGERA